MEDTVTAPAVTPAPDTQAKPRGRRAGEKSHVPSAREKLSIPKRRVDDPIVMPDLAPVKLSQFIPPVPALVVPTAKPATKFDTLHILMFAAFAVASSAAAYFYYLH